MCPDPSPSPESSAQQPPALPSRIVVPEEANLQRLDVFLVSQMSGLSRALLQRAIEAGGITVNDAPSKPSLRISTGDVIVIRELHIPRPGPQPEEIPLDVVYEDEDLVVINKPAGMIVHPAKGHWQGTLASALAHRFGQLSTRGGPARPGIVHRLDRETSGLIVVAKHDQAHDALAKQFQNRSVEKQYLAITAGVSDRDQDVINQPIADHPHDREKKAIRSGHESSREAITIYEVLERFAGFALLAGRPKTGRTHQIRIHFAHIGCPVLCDRLYGGRSRITLGDLGASAANTGGDEILLDRHALHSHRIAFRQPTTNERLQFESPLPADMQRTLEALRAWRKLPPNK